MGWLASTLLAGKKRDERNTANATVAETTARAVKIHADRRRVECVGAGSALVRFFFFMDTRTTAIVLESTSFLSD
jgi:hypothetical protein